jgi:hypothetical protein
MTTGGAQQPVSILEVFPPGPRRQAVLTLAEHPEYDAPDWHGRIIFRVYKTDKSGRKGLAFKVEPDEETIL